MNANAMRYRHLGSSGLRCPRSRSAPRPSGGASTRRPPTPSPTSTPRPGGTSSTRRTPTTPARLGNHARELAQGGRTRHEKIVASKVFFRTGDGPQRLGAFAEAHPPSVDESLRRLRTDYIDLYQLHCFDRSTPLEETLETLNDLVRWGKVRYLGDLELHPSQIVKIRMLCAARGWSAVASLQAEYSLMVQGSRVGAPPRVRRRGARLSRLVAARGRLAQREVPARGSAAARESRAGRGDRWDDLPAQRESELAWQVIETLRDASEVLGKTPAQVALGWLLSRPGVTAPVIGARSIAQLEENLGERRLAPAGRVGEEARAGERRRPSPTPTASSSATRKGGRAAAEPDSTSIDEHPRSRLQALFPQALPDELPHRLHVEPVNPRDGPISRMGFSKSSAEILNVLINSSLGMPVKSETALNESTPLISSGSNTCVSIGPLGEGLHSPTDVPDSGACRENGG